jgi:hypothetical protein
MTRRTLLLGTAGIVLFGVVVFALPLVATAVILAVTMLLTPAVWIVGSSYAVNGRQAFFRGGLIAGILPFVVASAMFPVFTMQLAAFGEIHGFSLFIPIYSVDPERRAAAIEAEDSSSGDSFYIELPQRLRLAALWLAPGIVASLGGTISYVTYRLVTPKQRITLGALPPLDFRVISGRLTTQDAEAN